MGPAGVSCSSDAAQALSNVANLTHFIEVLAKRMIDIMRAMSTDKVRGKAYRVETRVSIKWKWLVLPTLLVLLSIMHLIVSMVVSSRHQAPM